MIGRRIGSFVVTRVLGSGTFAEVVLAEEDPGARRYAIKLLKPRLGANPEARERFENEWRCSRALDVCEHIVHVHHHAVVEGRPALVMDYVEGAALDQLLGAVAGRGLPVERALAYAHDIAFAIAHAHRHGIVHRDLKPSNCLVDASSQRVFLTDFGIAFFPEAARPGGGRLTRADLILGTYEYMAPEVILGGAVAAVPASDVYSLGVVLFELLTGTLPYDDDDAAEIPRKALTDPIPPPSTRAAALPPGVDELVERCLQKKSADRYRDGAEVFRAIGELRASLGLLGAVAAPVEGVLVDLRDPLRPCGHAIPAAGISIGSDAGNDLVVDHRKVSSRHATVVPGPNGRFLLTDLGSTNGTNVRGRFLRGEGAELADGDTFFLGRQRALRFMVVRP